MTACGHIIFLGAPGAGKGTQAQVVAQRMLLPHVSTGDMLRASVGSGSEAGKRAKAIMESGALVGDDVILGIIAERLAHDDASGGVIFDGFPRTLVQAEGLDRLLESVGRLRVDHVLHIVLADEEIVSRLSGRRVCENCGAIYHVAFHPPMREGICDRCGSVLRQRDDDRPEVVRRRLAVYKSETEPLVSYYRNRAGYAEIDGSGDTAMVSARIAATLGIEG